MPNIWSRQAYVRGFGCESFTFKKYINMFEHMEIAESIYKCVVEPSYKTYPVILQPFWSHQEK